MSVCASDRVCADESTQEGLAETSCETSQAWRVSSLQFGPVAWSSCSPDRQHDPGQVPGTLQCTCSLETQHRCSGMISSTCGPAALLQAAGPCMRLQHTPQRQLEPSSRPLLQANLLPTMAPPSVRATKPVEKTPDAIPAC